jgi:hypothetical protein
MASEGKAAAKGGCGCLAAFAVLALLAAALGGEAYIDLGGVVILLVVGAVVGLIVNWIYQKGKRDAGS